MTPFLRGYVACALWLLRDENGNQLDHEYTPQDCGSLDQMARDCAEFQQRSADDLSTLDSEQAGHDFFLTRNHHGARFWDRGLGEVGERLTQAASAYGSTYEYAVEGKWYSE